MSITISPHLQGPAGSSKVRSFGMLSTFPPTPCGIATFAAALSAGLIANGSAVDVVRSGDAPPLEDPLVVASLGDGSRAQRALCVDALNATDVAIVQHEYGIYDGPDGNDVLGLMEELVVPVVLIAHTVVSTPTVGQRTVLERACALADTVVVMTDTARERLLAGFRVNADKVIVIPHGAATPPAAAASDIPGRFAITSSDSSDAIGAVAFPAADPPRLLTWGLLGPGKGIEWAIDAFAQLNDLDPAPTYVIAGATHPKVLEHAGEAYREMLIARADRSGAGSRITFDDSYQDLESLTAMIRSADLVVLPYDSADQVTSGVLVDAVAAGRPVVSTAFPHAVELLASGAGIVVAQRDPDALADAIRSVLIDPERAARMAAEARRLAPGLSWPAVAARYGRVGARLLYSRPVSA
jgi:glycosyltransferase involved in cell wall biosynthesis